MDNAETILIVGVVLIGAISVMFVAIAFFELQDIGEERCVQLPSDEYSSNPYNLMECDVKGKKILCIDYNGIGGGLSCDWGNTYG